MHGIYGPGFQSDNMCMLLRPAFSFIEGGHIRPDERDGILKALPEKEILPL
jgi:hypothetical protein